MKKIDEIHTELRQRKIPAWLFYDHHHRDAISYRILGLPESLMVSRRWFYLIPASGEPVKLLHRIEPHHLDALPGKKLLYAAWHELVRELRTMVSQMPAVAMQFSPENMIFLLSTADAGTVDLIRSFGVKVVSSAELVARFEATWAAKQIESHFAAARSIDVIMDEVFPEIGRRVRKGGTTEFEIQQWIVEAFRRDGVVADSPPIVAVNQNSSDPHYAPTADRCEPIREGDVVLLDVWGKLDQPDAVYYDISWTGFVGRSASGRVLEIFDIVRRSRDAAIQKVIGDISARKKLAGWEVDKTARDVLEHAGSCLAEYLLQRFLLRPISGSFREPLSPFASRSKQSDRARSNGRTVLMPSYSRPTFFQRSWRTWSSIA